VFTQGLQADRDVLLRRKLRFRDREVNRTILKVHYTLEIAVKMLFRYYFAALLFYTGKNVAVLIKSLATTTQTYVEGSRCFAFSPRHFGT